MALPKKSSYLMGGTFNATPPVMIDGDTGPFQLDTNGNLKVTFTGGSASNPAASPTGTPVPADASYTGINIGGTLFGLTGFNLTNSVPAAVAIVDGSGNQITSFGGGSQFAMGSAQASNAQGTIALGYDGTNVRGLLTSNTGQLHAIIDSATLGTVTVTGTVTANQGNPNTLANAWPVEVTDGTNVLGTATHPLRVDPTGTTTQPVSVSNFPATQNVVGTTADGTTAETNFLVVGGESNDATAQYQPIPLGAGGRSVIIEGFTGGTAVPISGTVSVTNFANPLPVSQSGLWNVNQAIGVAGFEKITDGLNTAAVKAASTSPVAADPALVVAISPNTGTLNVSVQNASLSVTQGTSPWVTSDNHFPASVALADNLANPTTTEIGSNLLGWDATNSVWRRVQVTAGTGTLMVTSGGGGGGGTSAVDESAFVFGTTSETPAGGVNTGGSNVPTVLPGQTGTLQMTGDRKLVVSNPDLASINDLMQTLILEVRAMRAAIVYMVTESGQVLTSDFDPANPDFLPVN